MVYPVKNQAVQPKNTIDEGDYPAGEFSIGGDFEGPDFSQDHYVGGQGEGSIGPLGVKELRKRIQHLMSQLESSSLRQGRLEEVRRELQGLLSKVNQGAFAKDRANRLAQVEGELSGIESQILGIDEAADLPGGWGDEAESETAEPVTAGGIQELIQALEKGEREVEEGSKVSKEECLKILREALADCNNGREKAAAAGYAEALGHLGGPKDPAELMGENYGETPHKVDKNTAFFDGKKGESSFSFKSADQGKTCVVENASEISITPKDKNTTVTVTEEGENYVITVGSDTFKINRDAKIRIYSDKVSGKEIGNAKGNLVIGATEKTERKFMDPAKAKEIAQKLFDSLGKIGCIDTFSGIGFSSNQQLGQPSFPDQPAEIKPSYGVQGFGPNLAPVDAKMVIQAVAEALQETDPSKQKDAWENALDSLKRVKTETEGAQFTNDKAQIIFNVLHGELGEDGLKEALKSGLIPEDFSAELSTQLELEPNEIGKRSEIDGFQLGGPGWTHGTSSEFLKKHSKGEDQD